MRLVFFDLETGGLDPQLHPITQIAAVAVDDNLNELATFEAKVMFDLKAADPEALEKNSFDPDIWERDAISPANACRDLSKFLTRFADVRMVSQRTGNPYQVAQLIGHNADSFDGPFLQAWYKRLGQFMPAAFRVLCTYQLAMHHFQCRAVQPDNFKLEGLAKYYGIEHANAHDAIADVRANIAVYRALKEDAVAEARKAIEAMVPWALLGLVEGHPAIQYARSLGITAGPAASVADQEAMANAILEG